MAIGLSELAKYRAGKRLTPGQAIKAKCAECCGDYRDPESKADCGVESCPLHPMMAYVVRAQRKAVKSERAAAGGVGVPGGGLRAYP
jgi:hypothetical protein